jgi:hypothetical protein
LNNEKEKRKGKRLPGTKKKKEKKNATDNNKK